MPYYPSSQVKTNLYTNGGEFVRKIDNTSYIGFYWKTSSGKYFSGKNPQEPNSTEIIQPPVSPGNNNPGPTGNGFSDISTNNTSIISNTSISVSYPKYDPNMSRSRPLYVESTPTNQEYTQGYFTRYFCKKTNEFTYLEIDKDTYDKLVAKDPKMIYQLYKPFKIKWQLSGNDFKTTYSANQVAVELIIKNQQMYLFDLYLKKDYLKFWSPI